MIDFWNFSTSVRNPERLPDFLKVASLLEGKTWNEETQIEFQILLIQHRLYLNSDNSQSLNKLSLKQIEWLKDKTYEMSFEEAKNIFEAKQYIGGAMRGRQSMNPLKKLGYIYAEKNEIIRVTEIGKKLLEGIIPFDEALLKSLLKYQLPNPVTEGCEEWNSKPFISTLRLIKRVNELCEERHEKVKGISTTEFGIFCLSLTDYTRIDDVAKEILKFRHGFEAIRNKDFLSYKDFKEAQTSYCKTYINTYLADYTNPEKNCKEYGDSMKRYLRQTKYIRFLGAYGNQYIDLEPRRSIEISSILENDSGQPIEFTKDGWIDYIGGCDTYELPFENIASLSKILKAILDDIATLEEKTLSPREVFSIPSTKHELKTIIEKARNYRTALQNKEIKFDYAQDLTKIDNAISILNDISINKQEKLINKPSVELEKWLNIALNIINDAIQIKPNAPVGDDNEPTFTAPANVPDIECIYENFRMICEVTTLKGRDQWYNEGQPVMRHLRDFEMINAQVPCYCLFVAPSLHEDTLETYWVSVKHGYKGATQKIIPMTIKQITKILSIVKNLKLSGKTVDRKQMINLYNNCLNINSFDSSSDWPNFIETQINLWKDNLFLV